MAYQDTAFNSWHKNRWDMDKLTQYALEAGFSKVENSKYGNSPIFLDDKIEKTCHSDVGRYFNLYKPV